MAFAAYNYLVTDNAGNAISGATIEVRRESDNGLAILYADREGATPLANPFVASQPRGRFHVIGGAYKIAVSKAGASLPNPIQYQAVGRMAESDGIVSFDGEWDSEVIYPSSASVTYGGYVFVSRVNDNEGNEPDDTPGDTMEWMFIPTIRGEDGAPGDPGPQGLNWRGPWSAGSYAQFDAVSKGTASYVANTATSQEPPGSDWDLLVPAGPTGPSGVRGGLRYTFDSATGVSNPGAGKFRITSAGNAGFVVSETTADGGSISALLNSYGFVQNDPIGTIIVQSADPAGSVYYMAEIISPASGGTGWSQLSVSQQAGSLPANGADCVISFLFRGSNGIRVSPPATATSSGSVGEWAVDASYFYACVANNTWRRVAISSW